MSYTVEEVNGCTKKLVFNFETLDLTAEIKSAVLEKQKTVTLKGFRKGKAPLSMVENIYGEQIEMKALDNFIQTQLFSAIQESDLKVVGRPNFENFKYDPKKSVSFDAVVEFIPAVEIKDMSGYSFEKESAVVTDEDVEAVKANYLSSKAEVKPIEDETATVQNGNLVILNFEGEKEDGTRPEEMKGKEFQLEIGSNQFIPGFEEGLIGTKAGEKKELALSFPSDYHVEDLKDAKVKFYVEVLELKERILPDFTDELAKEFNFESVEDFMTKNKEQLVQRKEREVKEKLNQAIVEKLVEDNKIDVPQALVLQQEQHIQEDVDRTLTQQGFTDEMKKEYFEKWRADVTTKAEFQVRSGLILEELAKKFEIETTDADFNAKVEEMAAGSGLPLEQIKSYYTSNENLKNNIKYAIREEKTFAKIAESVKITEK